MDFHFIDVRTQFRTGTSRGPGQTDSESEERLTTFQVGTLEELDDHADSAA